MKTRWLQQFGAFAEPGAWAAILLVLLMLAAADAAITIAARGWPF